MKKGDFFANHLRLRKAGERGLGREGLQFFIGSGKMYIHTVGHGGKEGNNLRLAEYQLWVTSICPPPPFLLKSRQAG